MTFGTFEQPQKFNCVAKGCKWEEKTVKVDYMFFGAGMSNPEAMNPVMCAQRCALDVNCGAFEYDSTPQTNYCVWWGVDKCDVGHPNATNNFMGKSKQ